MSLGVRRALSHAGAARSCRIADVAQLGDDHQMRLPWRRSDTAFSADPALEVADRPCTFTQEHQRLLTTFDTATDEPWSRAALRACLEHLRVSTLTEAADIAVEDAWLDGPTAFCIVYRTP
jgi:hypothetical protein